MRPWGVVSEAIVFVGGIARFGVCCWLLFYQKCSDNITNETTF